MMVVTESRVAFRNPFVERFYCMRQQYPEIV